MNKRTFGAISIALWVSALSMRFIAPIGDETILSVYFLCLTAAAGSSLGWAMCE